jgi:hypothetical protein
MRPANPCQMRGRWRPRFSSGLPHNNPMVRFVVIAGALLLLTEASHAQLAVADFPDVHAAVGLPTICPEDTPATVYFCFRTAVMDARDVEDIAPFFAAEMREGLALLPEDVAAGLLDHLQDAYPAAMELLEETLEEDTATLRLSGMHDGVRHEGTVVLVLEDGAWRIRREDWELRFD